MNNYIGWVDYIDRAGYVSFEEYMKIPPKDSTMLLVIKIASSLKHLKIQLGETKEKEARKRINKRINDLEKFFKPNG